MGAGRVHHPNGRDPWQSEGQNQRVHWNRAMAVRANCTSFGRKRGLCHVSREVSGALEGAESGMVLKSHRRLCCHTRFRHGVWTPRASHDSFNRSGHKRKEKGTALGCGHGISELEPELGSLWVYSEVGNGPPSRNLWLDPSGAKGGVR